MCNVAHLPEVFRVASAEEHELKLLAIVLRGGKAKHAGDVIMGDAYKLTCSHRRQIKGLRGCTHRGGGPKAASQAAGSSLFPPKRLTVLVCEAECGPTRVRVTR